MDVIRVRGGAAIIGAARRKFENEKRVDWREDSKCGNDGIDPELFFPIGYKSGPDLKQVEQAKSICKQCPAKQDCLEWAIENGVVDGVFGGLTPDERKIFKMKGN